MQFALISTAIIPDLVAALTLRDQQKQADEQARSKELAAQGIHTMFRMEVPNLAHFIQILQSPPDLSLNKFGLPLPPTDGKTQFKLLAENLHRRITREISLIKAKNDEPYLLLQSALEDAPLMACPFIITFTVGDEQYDVGAWGEDHAREQLKQQPWLSHFDHSRDFAFSSAWCNYANGGVTYRGKAPREPREDEDVEVLLDQNKVRDAIVNGQLDLAPLFTLVTPDVTTRIRRQIGEWDAEQFWLVDDLLLYREPAIASVSATDDLPF